MDQSNDRPALWPPCFANPPSPMPNKLLASDELSTHDFILQCINNQRNNANGQHDVNDNSLFPCSVSSTTNCDIQYSPRKRARNKYTQNPNSGSSHPAGIIRNNNIQRQILFN